MVKKRNKAEQLIQDAAKAEELQQRYDLAMKQLGEKDIELAILRELVKKKHPDWRQR
ncbi:hypothetical protein D3C71_2152930 [compost metagenome]